MTKEELQATLADGIVKALTANLEKQTALSPEKKDDNKDDKPVEKTVTNPDALTAKQFTEGLATLGETLLKGVAELTKTKDQKVAEKQVQAEKFLKEYFEEAGIDIGDAKITLSEVKKSGGLNDGDSFGIKLFGKDGKELGKIKSDNSDDENNQFNSVDDIPEDVQKQANNEIWKGILGLKSKAA